jgi:hypothetical protein
VWLVPSTLTPVTDERFEIAVHANTGPSSCIAWGFDLRYQGGCLDYIGYRNGTGSITYIEEWSDTGQVSLGDSGYSYVAPSPDTVVATLTFLAVGASSPTITVSVNNLIGIDSNPIGVHTGSSVQITITGSSTPVPTPGTTLVPTPTPVSPGETPMPTVVGNLYWMGDFYVYDAANYGNPAIENALVAVSALTKNAGYTNSLGRCNIQAYAHDTGSVSVTVSASGYTTFTQVYPTLENVGRRDIGLVPDGTQDTRTLTLNIIGRDAGIMSIDTPYADPPNTAITGNVQISYDYGTSVSLFMLSGTPPPPPGQNDPPVRYQVAKFNGSSSTLDLVMDADRTVTVNYSTIVIEPIPTVAPSRKGDVNGNGSVDIVDALLVAQYYVGLAPAGFIASNADVNCSGTVDIVDALMIAQYYVGLITGFC